MFTAFFFSDKYKYFEYCSFFANATCTCTCTCDMYLPYLSIFYFNMNDKTVFFFNLFVDNYYNRLYAEGGGREGGLLNSETDTPM